MAENVIGQPPTQPAGAPVSHARPETQVKPGMVETTDPLVADLWHHAGGHLVSITKVYPDRPHSSPNRYVFRETDKEMQTLVKHEQDMNHPIVTKLVKSIAESKKEGVA